MPPKLTVEGFGTFDVPMGNAPGARLIDESRCGPASRAGGQLPLHHMPRRICGRRAQ